MHPAGGSAIAGVLEALPDLLGVYAGSVLSSSRLKPGNWAGANACWGLENREAAVRFVAATPGNPHGANAELKLIDPSANPYLAIAGFPAVPCSAWAVVHRPRGDTRKSPTHVRRSAAPAGRQENRDRGAESSSRAADLSGAAVIEGLVAVRRYEMTTFGDLPLAETCQALRLAWSC